MKLICVLFVAFALGATPASADPEEPKYEAKIVPKCSLIKTAAGGETCGYTLGEWNLVLEFDAELVSKRKLLGQEKERTSALKFQVTNLKTQVETCAANQGTLVEYVKLCTKERIECDRKYQNERVKPRLGSGVAWTIAAVSAAVMVGFVGKDLLD